VYIFNARIYSQRYYIFKEKYKMTAEKALDETDRSILAALLHDARLSLKALAAQVRMSGPSVSERLRRLESRGIVRGYTADLDPYAMGYQLQVIVRIRPLPGRLAAVQKLIESTREFCECDKVTGDDCYIVRLFVRNIDELDVLLAGIADKAETHTALVKSQPIRRRPPPLLPS
jgi:Lrp/AsnC family transcriptional regulator, leucine-responsive regulatory protein